MRLCNWKSSMCTYSPRTPRWGLIPMHKRRFNATSYCRSPFKRDQFRAEHTTVSHSLLEDSTSEVIECFDGQAHRYFWQHGSTNADTDEEVRSGGGGMVSDERPSLSNLVRPHMFLLESGAPRVPLSTYLKGTEAVLAHPSPGVSVSSAIEILDLGSDEFEGMKCRRIRIESFSGESPHSAWELWLAEERNLIPVHRLGYNYIESTDIPGR